MKFILHVVMHKKGGHRSLFTWLCSLFTKAPFIHHSGDISITRKTRRYKSVKNSSTVSSGRRRHVVKWRRPRTNLFHLSFIRAGLIFSMSSPCSFDNCRYISLAMPCNRSGRACPLPCLSRIVHMSFPDLPTIPLPVNPSLRLWTQGSSV